MAKWYEKIFNWKAGSVKAQTSYGTPFRISGMGQMVWGQENAERYVKDGYTANDVVYSILNMAAEKERMAPWNVYKIKDESSLKQYKSELAKLNGSIDKGFSLKKCLDFRTKAMELYTGDGKLNDVLNWANEEETFQDLVANSGAAKRLTGNRYLWASLLDAGANRGKPQELYLLPSQHIQVFASRTFPERKTGYRMQIGNIIDFKPEEVMHEKMWNPVYDAFGSNLVGMSPLKAALYNLVRNKYAKQASAYSFQNLGPDTIVYTDDARLTADQGLEQAAAIKKKLHEEYSGSVNRKKMAVSGYKMGAVNLGLSPVDLNILEQEKWDVVSFANLWNFPHILLVPERATLNNLMVAERALTSRCAIPYLRSFAAHFNRKLSTDWGYKGTGIIVDFDVSVYPEMQKDKADLTGWLANSPLSIRQRFEELEVELPPGYDSDPDIDRIILPLNTVFIEDYSGGNINGIMDGLNGANGNSGQQGEANNPGKKQ